MNDVNWWLMALAFLLGLLLTFAFMIRRVKREVPVYAALGRGPGVGYKGPDADVKKPDVDVKKPDAGVEAPDVNLKGAGLAAGAAAVGGAAAAKFVGGKDDEEPYGSGSLRLARGAVVPSGYTIKGNEDSMLYHTPDSPSYKETDAEVWFRDKESAEAAGFKKYQ
jgi:uncharacterized membrane protein ArfC